MTVIAIALFALPLVVVFLGRKDLRDLRLRDVVLLLVKFELFLLLLWYACELLNLAYRRGLFWRVDVAFATVLATLPTLALVLFLVFRLRGHLVEKDRGLSRLTNQESAWPFLIPLAVPVLAIAALRLWNGTNYALSNYPLSDRTQAGINSLIHFFAP